MAFSQEFINALKKIAFGFEYENLDEEYLTAREFEEKMKKNYGGDKKAKDDKGLASKQASVNGQIDMFGEKEVVSVDENVNGNVEAGGVSKKRGRKKSDEKHNLICVKRKTERRYHAPEVSALKMLAELESNEETSGVDRIVEEIKSMPIDELLELRLKLLTELESDKSEK